jgi:hypothetical protein
VWKLGEETGAGIHYCKEMREEHREALRSQRGMVGHLESDVKRGSTKPESQEELAICLITYVHIAVHHQIMYNSIKTHVDQSREWSSNNRHC